MLASRTGLLAGSLTRTAAAAATASGLRSKRTAVQYKVPIRDIRFVMEEVKQPEFMMSLIGWQLKRVDE